MHGEATGSGKKKGGGKRRNPSPPRDTSTDCNPGSRSRKSEKAAGDDDAGMSIIDIEVENVAANKNWNNAENNDKENVHEDTNPEDASTSKEEQRTGNEYDES